MLRTIQVTMLVSFVKSKKKRRKKARRCFAIFPSQGFLIMIRSATRNQGFPLRYSQTERIRNP